jgi:hypothetical protein
MSGGYGLTFVLSELRKEIFAASVLSYVEKVIVVYRTQLDACSINLSIDAFYRW